MNFLRRNRFWVALALLLIVSGLAFGAYAKMRAANTERADEIAGRQKELAKYAEGGQIVSEEWIDQARKRQGVWKEEIKQTRQLLMSQDDLVEQYFRDPDHPESREPLDSGIWKLVYQEKMHALTQKVQSSFPVVGKAPLIKKEYGQEWLEEEIMRAGEKQFWIQKYLVDALAALNEKQGEPVVEVFGGFQFLQQPERLLHPAHQRLFRPIPFRVRIATTFPDVPRVIHALREHKANFRVTGFEVVRSSLAGERERAKKTTAGPPPELTQPETQPAETEEKKEQEGPPRGALMSPDVPESVRQALQRLGVGPGGPTGAVPGAGPGERQAPEKPQEIEVEKPKKKQLPANLVDITIHGYVADFAGG